MKTATKAPVHALWDNDLQCTLKLYECGGETCRDVDRSLETLGSQAAQLIGRSPLYTYSTVIIEQLRDNTVQNRRDFQEFSSIHVRVEIASSAFGN